MSESDELIINGRRLVQLVNGRKGAYVPDHPKRNSRGYVLLARYLMEQHLGRYLTEYEQVHHINGLKTDDRLENLVVVTKGEHFSIHSDSHRELDYTRIKELMDEGLGYRRIAKMLDYNPESTKSAVRRIRKESPVGEK
jgi:hypothetical protein